MVQRTYRELAELTSRDTVSLPDVHSASKDTVINIEIDFVSCLFKVNLHLRFYLILWGCYLGSSRPSVDRALSTLGCFIIRPDRISKFKIAGRHGNPAIIQVATPIAIK